MSKLIRNAVLLAVAGISSNVMAVEFTGYGRAGMSTTSNGGEQACFGSGATGHYTGRLGDECDTYIEIGLGQEVYKQDDKVFKVNTMLSYQTDQGAQFNDYQSLTEPGLASSKGDIALRQFNVEATGVLDFAPEATLWAGKKFYQRKDVHILDLYYLNNSGYGLGVEHIDLGSGKLSLAWTNSDEESRSGKMNAESQRMVQVNKLDIRYADIPLWQDTSLELAAIFGFGDTNEIQEQADEPSETGLFLTAEITQKFTSLTNHIVFQYSNDSMAEAAWRNASGSRSVNVPSWQGTLDNAWRFIDYGEINLSEKVDLNYSFIYQKGETISKAMVSETEPTRMSAVVRGSYSWSDSMKTTIEIGYDDVQESNMVESVDLQKFVVAQEWAPLPGLTSRPVIRFYAGSFFGEGAEQRRSGSSDGEDGNIRFGAQVEAWW